VFKAIERSITIKMALQHCQYVTTVTGMNSLNPFFEARRDVRLGVTKHLLPTWRVIDFSAGNIPIQ
jgi:hypothetical protein